MAKKSPEQRRLDAAVKYLRETEQELVAARRKATATGSMADSAHVTHCTNNFHLASMRVTEAKKALRKAEGK